MKGRVIVSRFWTNLLSGKRAAAITLFPFILLLNKAQKQDTVLINHERIHLAQALELLVLPFYILYLSEFLLRYLYFRDFKKAYLNISFEREAYQHEADLQYLKYRGFWAFLNYIRK